MKKIFTLVIAICLLTSCENYELLGIGEYRFYIPSTYFEQEADFLFELKSNSKIQYDFIELESKYTERMGDQEYGVFEVLIPNGNYQLEVITDLGYQSTLGSLGLLSRSGEKEIVINDFDKVP